MKLHNSCDRVLSKQLGAKQEKTLCIYVPKSRSLAIQDDIFIGSRPNSLMLFEPIAALEASYAPVPFLFAR
jgi:hypothetical protein